MEANQTVNDSAQSTTLIPTENAVYIIAPETLRLIYLLISAFGFTLNLLTMIVIGLYKPMHKQLTNIFIFNQSLIDAMASVFLFFSTIYVNDLIKRTPGNLADEVLCRIWFTQVPLYGMLVSSTYGIVAVTFERYLAVVYPIWHMTKFTRPKLAAILVAVWLCGTSYYLSFAIATTRITEQGICSIFVNYPSKLWERVAAVIDIIAVYLVPLLILAYCYIKMALALRGKVKRVEAAKPVIKSIPVAEQNVEALKSSQHADKDKTLGSEASVKAAREEVSDESNAVNGDKLPVISIDGSSEKQASQVPPSKPAGIVKESAMTTRARKNIIKTLILVSCGFVFCWSWSKIYFLMFHLGYDQVDFTGIFFNFTVIILYCNCCINPIIYCIQYKQFQSGIRWIVCRGFVVDVQQKFNNNSQKSRAANGDCASNKADA